MPTPIFSYGDKIKRKTGGPVHVVKYISDNIYHFTDGTFALVDDQDCYILVEKSSGYFRVAATLEDAPLKEYLYYGYETCSEFSTALRRLVDRWSGRVGESIDVRNKFLLIRFHDTPGGKPDEAWLPCFLLTPESISDQMDEPTEEDELYMSVFN